MKKKKCTCSVIFLISQVPRQEGDSQESNRIKKAKVARKTKKMHFSVIYVRKKVSPYIPTEA